ncbi:MAG: hypothetical protein FK734_07705, partial [Asgard group archaeon]|nr:hypothetical protein [Asgard group archaeon]
LGIFLGISTFTQFNIFSILYIAQYLLLVTFACNINCYFDMDVDKKYKTNLYESMNRLGKKNVKYILIIELILISIIFIIFLLNKFYITFGLIIFGSILSIIYSARPFRVKSKGLWSPIPVIIGMFALPLLGGYFLTNFWISLEFLLFVIGYSLFNEGINFINTCEDYSEDKESGIETWAHVFGLEKTINFAFIFTLVGTILANLSLLLTLIFTENINSIFFFIILGFIILSLVFSFITSLEVHKVKNRDDLELSAKDNAKNVPKWFIMTRYPLLIVSILLLIF